MKAEDTKTSPNQAEENIPRDLCLHEPLSCPPFIFKAGLTDSVTSRNDPSPFLSPAGAGVSSLPGEVPGNNPERAGAARAEPPSVPLLHHDLRRHGAVRVRGSRVRTRAVRSRVRTRAVRAP